MTTENQFIRDFIVGLREDIKGIRADIKEIILSINSHKIELENKATQEDLFRIENEINKKIDKKIFYNVSITLLVLILIIAINTDTANEIIKFIINRGKIWL